MNPRDGTPGHLHRIAALQRHRPELRDAAVRGGADRHRDAHRGAAVDPRVVRDGVGERQGRLGAEGRLHHLPVEGLAEAVRGDEPEALRLPRADELGGPVPPVHHEVERLGQRRVGRADGVYRGVAEGLPHALVPDERGIADDEVGLGPRGDVDALEVDHGDGGGRVGDLLAGDAVGRERETIPAEEGAAVGGDPGDRARSGDEGVAALDGPCLGQDRIGHGLGAAVVDLPLEVRHPQDELGDLGGPRVQLDAEEVLRDDGCGRAGEREPLLAAEPEGAHELEDLVFEGLQGGVCDDEEVAGAAGGVEDAEGPETLQEGLCGVAHLLLDRRRHVRRVGDALLDVGLDGVPCAAEGFVDGADDEALDEGAGGVVGAESVAFTGGEGALEERAEDGRVALGPVEGGEVGEELDGLAVEREGSGVMEEGAVEAADRGEVVGSALVHR